MLAVNRPTFAAASSDPCVEEKQIRGVHMRTPDNPIDWRCMRQQAKNGDYFQQFYVGMHLLYGTSFEGRKVSEGIELLKSSAKNSRNYSAMRLLALAYFSGLYDVPRNRDLAYQWAFLCEQEMAKFAGAAVQLKPAVAESYRADEKAEHDKTLAEQSSIVAQVEKEISKQKAKGLREESLKLLQ